jgi:hypothetical protein
VTNLLRSKSLRKLVLGKLSVTDAGLVGLELAPALEFVDLRYCAHGADIAAVAPRAAARSVKVLLLRRRVVGDGDEAFRDGRSYA